MLTSRIAAVVVLSALAGCSGGGGDGLATSSAAIANGSLTDHRGVVAIVTTSPNAICSGVVIAPRVVLTARHCVAPVENGPSVDCGRTRFGGTIDPDSIYVATTTDGGAIPNRRHGVVRVLVPDDPSFCGQDLAALILPRPLGEAVVVPLRDARARSGETFTAIGFGRDGGEKSGTRRRRDGLRVSCVGKSCANTQLTEREWWGEGAVCDGDSGGPALDGEGRVIGIASRKRDGCAATVYLDVATSTAFVSNALEVAAKTPETDDPKACSYGRSSGALAPVTLLVTLAAARCRRLRRRPRDCAHTPDPSAPRRSV